MVIPTDPIVQLKHLCIGASGKPCGGAMGGCCVYQGKGTLTNVICEDPWYRLWVEFYLLPEISQLIFFLKCTICHWTIFHTLPYLVEDAERLVIHLNDPTNPAGLPTLLHPAPPLSPLHQPPALNPTQNQPATQAINSNRIYCSNLTCVTKKKKWFANGLQTRSQMHPP